MKKFDFTPLYPGKQKKVHNSKVCLSKKICSCSALQFQAKPSLSGLWYCPTCSSAGVLQSRANRRRAGRRRIDSDEEEEDAEIEAEMAGFIVDDDEEEPRMWNNDWSATFGVGRLAFVLPRTLATVRVRERISNIRRTRAARPTNLSESVIEIHSSPAVTPAKRSVLCSSAY